MDQIAHIDEPIEILVDLAKQGEFDPWKIDVVKVADKFLERIESVEVPDLRLSGRTLFYAAILLRMKSEALFIEEEEDLDEDLEPDLLEIEEDMEGEVFTAPDSIRVYPKLRRKRKRPITLDDLITELKKAEKVEINRQRRQKARVECDDALTKNVRECPHEEDIESKISKLREILKKREKEKRISFSELTSGMEVRDVIDTYIPLLFLASRKEVRLKQDELFGELYIDLREGIDEGKGRSQDQTGD